MKVILLLLLALIAPATSAVPPAEAVPVRPPTLVRWSFWVPPQRMAEFAPVFDADIAPLLEKHGLTDPQPDTRVIPDSLFNRVYAVPSRQAFEAMRDSTYADPAFLELMRSLGERVDRTGDDGRLQSMVALYSDPAGPGKKRYAPPGRDVPVGMGRGHWTTYRVPDGLPGLDIQHLFEDQAGNIWVSTFGSGVSRWDGERFTTFTPDNGLAGLQPRYALQDRAGNIWFAVVDGGISRFDGESMISFGPEDGVPKGISFIMEDRRGHLWMPTPKGLVRYDGEVFHAYDGVQGLDWLWKTTIHEDRDGRLWLATSEGVKRWDGHEPVRFEPVGPPMPHGGLLLEDRRGAIWVAGFRDVVRFHGDSWEVLTAEGGPLAEAAGDWNVENLLEDRHGNVWVLTEKNGAFRWDGENWMVLNAEQGFNKWSSVMLEDTDGTTWFAGNLGLQRWDGAALTSYTTADGLDNDNIRTAILDRQGDLWIGTIGNLSRFGPSRFVTFRAEHGIAGDAGYEAIGDREGNMWFSSTDGGVTRYDGETFATWTDDDFPSLVAFQDRAGAIWFSKVGQDIHRLVGDTLTTYAPADGLAPWFHGRIIQDPSGALWISGQGGVSRYDGETFEHFTVQDGLRPDYVGRMLFDRDGRLWLSEGKTVYDGERFAPSGIEDQLDGSYLKLLDRDGDIWFATMSHGVSRWDGERLVRYTTRDGLAHNATRGIFQSADGHIWIGTDGGVVSRFDGRVFQTLSREDGLNGQSVRDIDQDGAGDIWFTTYQGVIRYRQSESSPPAVYVDAAVADRRYADPRSVSVPSTVDLVAFEFHGRSPTTPAGNHVYLYRLDGHEVEWQQTRERRVEYADLPPGDYTFQIQAVDRDLVYSDTVSVAVGVYYQPAFGSLALDSLRVEELFASFQRDYAERPVASVQVTNSDPDTVSATLSFQLVDWMRHPVRQELVLAPGESRSVVFPAPLDGSILDLRETTTTPARVQLSFAAGQDTVSVQRTVEVTIHPRGAMRWDSVARAAAFVTPEEPAVAAIARGTLVAFEEESRSLGKPGHNLLQAAALFEALREHGVRYLVDANTPYSRVRADRDAVDHIQYPAQVLAGKAEDCDDLTVLYCSLLESAGIPTALVDFPGHVFPLFDSGVARWETYKLPVDPRLTVVRNEQLWIPVEIALLDGPFDKAWRAGADQLAQLSGVEQRRLIVDTSQAWESHPSSTPSFGIEVEAPTGPALVQMIDSQQAVLSEMIETQIRAQYLDPIKADPDDNALRTQLLRVYVALAQYDAAISAGLDFLIDHRGDRGATHNHLGIAHYLKGDTQQAASDFQQAQDLAPEDEGIRRNLTQAMWALGRSEEPVAAGVTVAAAEGLKGDSGRVDGDSFYWIE